MVPCVVVGGVGHPRAAACFLVGIRFLFSLRSHSLGYTIVRTDKYVNYYYINTACNCRTTVCTHVQYNTRTRGIHSLLPAFRLEFFFV